MHSDEMANVNELLVQLDRVSHLGRLVVGTTNFITSLDDAVVRSGRFGRFVPVPPPDIDEAIDILNYYLKSLVDHEDTNNQPRVQVPEAEELRSILRPLLAENALSADSSVALTSRKLSTARTNVVSDRPSATIPGLRTILVSM